MLPDADVIARASQATKKRHESYGEYARSDDCSPFDVQARDAIAAMQQMGVQILYTGGHHRKLVVIDRRVMYEGSLNVLSQNNSSEIMRRIESEELAREMVGFVGLGKFC